MFWLWVFFIIVIVNGCFELFFRLVVNCSIVFLLLKLVKIMLVILGVFFVIVLVLFSIIILIFDVVCSVLLL